MPLGMGPAGWFIWPYLANWIYPWYGYPGYRVPGYGYGVPYAGYPGYGFPYPPVSSEQEVGMLQDQAKFLEGELARIKSRIEELQKAKSE